MPNINQTGLTLIKSFEGLRMTAYLDQAGIETIGYGHTGSEVKAGMVITEAQATAFLQQDLTTSERAVQRLVGVQLTPNQFSALVSLVFNIGEGAFAESTLLKKLNAGDVVGAGDQFLVWNKITIDGVLTASEGLNNRRQAERKLFLTADTTAPATPPPAASKNQFPKRLFCPAEDSVAFRSVSSQVELDLAEWVTKRLGGTFKIDPNSDKVFMSGLTPTKPPAKPPAVKILTPGGHEHLVGGVTYYSQRDSQVNQEGVNQAGRSCYSSTDAAFLKFHKPEALPDTPNADDVYLSWLEQNAGDTTDPQAQVKALAHFGLAARQRQDMGWADVEALINKGDVVPVAFFHHGPLDSPWGGHWILITGYDDTRIRVNDPYGEADLVNGTYDTSQRGEGLWYSKANFGRRWMCNDNGTPAPNKGWGMVLA